MQRACSGPHITSQVPRRVDVAEGAWDLGDLLRAGTAQQGMALFRLIIRELRVMTRGEILPTYKIPALVRAPKGQTLVRWRFQTAERLQTGLPFTALAVDVGDRGRMHPSLHERSNMKGPV